MPCDSGRGTEYHHYADEDVSDVRLGFQSKMIVTKDSQIDLPRNVKSGLIDAQEKLKNISQIDFVHFS